MRNSQDRLLAKGEEGWRSVGTSNPTKRMKRWAGIGIFTALMLAAAFKGYFD